MRRHVVRAFGIVLEEWIAVGRQARGEALQITPHFRVRILRHAEARAGVAQEQVTEPRAHPRLGDPRLHLVGQLLEAATTRCNSYRYLPPHARTPDDMFGRGTSVTDG